MAANGAEETPADKIAKALGYSPSQVQTVTLSDGRSLTMRQPRGSDRFKAAELAGGTADLIPTFQALMCVIKIDGEPVDPPVSRGRMDHLGDMLGGHGMDEVMIWFQESQYPELQELLASGVAADDPDLPRLVKQARIDKVKKSTETQP